MSIINELERRAGRNGGLVAVQHGTSDPDAGSRRGPRILRAEPPRRIATIPEALAQLELGSDLEEFLRRINDLPDRMRTGAAGNLTSGEQIVDATSEGRRFLIYPRNPEDDKAYEILHHLGIPQLERVKHEPNPDVTVVNLPSGAWRLDSSDFPEQVPTAPAGNGAIEIMTQLGQLLGEIGKKTGLLPKDFGLKNVAYVTGHKNFLKLIPPYSFSDEVTPEELIERVRRDLDIIDPANPHAVQIQPFSSALYNQQ